MPVAIRLNMIIFDLSIRLLLLSSNIHCRFTSRQSTTPPNNPTIASRRCRCRYILGTMRFGMELEMVIVQIMNAVCGKLDHMRAEK